MAEDMKYYQPSEYDMYRKICGEPYENMKIRARKPDHAGMVEHPPECTGVAYTRDHEQHEEYCFYHRPHYIDNIPAERPFLTRIPLI